MVIEPVVTTSEVGLPDIVPYSPEEITAILAGPPTRFPATADANSKKKSAPPALERNVPNSTNRNAYVAATRSGTPNRPSLVNIIMSMK